MRRLVDQLQAAIRWATPGQVDSGFNSLATFLAGIFAVRELSPGGLAVYALLFGAFNIMNQVSLQTVFQPSQIMSVRLSESSRLGMLRYSLRAGSIISQTASTCQIAQRERLSSRIELKPPKPVKIAGCID